MEKFSLGYNLNMTRSYFSALLFLAAAGVLPGIAGFDVCAQGVRTIPAARNFNARLAANSVFFLNFPRSASFSGRSLPHLSVPRGTRISASAPARTGAPSLYIGIRGQTLPGLDNSAAALLRDKKLLSLDNNDAAEMPAGQVWETGALMMDRVLGAKSAASIRGDGAPEVVALEHRDSAPVQKEISLSPSSRKSMPRAQKNDFAGNAVLLGLGTISLSGTTVALDPGTMIAGYFTMILPSLVLHEMGHAKAAEVLGDPSPRLAGRLEWSWGGFKTHVDPLWSLILPLLSFGMVAMARPINADGNNFKHPIYGMAKTALAGPAVNAALAFLGAVAFGVLSAAGIGGIAAKASALFVFFNVALAMVNLVPLFPMDGQHILFAALHAVSPGLRAGLQGIYDKAGAAAAAPMLVFFLVFGKYLGRAVEGISGALLKAAAAAFGFLF